MKLKANKKLPASYKPIVTISADVKSNELMFQRLGFDRSPEMMVGQMQQKVN